MAKLVIIADDLTGALDTGVQFSKKNMSVAVTTDINCDFENEFNEMDVIVIDTESRHISKEQAKKRVKSAVSKFNREKVEFFYKKMDSTLRGNIGSELEGFMEGLGINELSFVPAFPSGKRTVKNGILYVNGVKLADTQFAQDILNPVNDSYIPDIIGKQTDIKVLKSEIHNLVPNEDKENQERKIYLFDSENIEEMAKIGRGLNDKKLLNFTAGNAGFAEILTDYLNIEGKKPKISIDDKRILFVCGSVNITSLNQCRFAEKIGYISKSLNFNDIISEKYSSSRNYMADREYFKMKLEAHEKLLLKTSSSDDVIKIALEYSKRNNIPMETLTLNIAENTGKLVSEIVKDKKIQNLIVFGGDTLMGILKNIGCRYIVPVAEILPGIVFTKAVGKEFTVNVITKAGGFGEEDVVQKIEKFIRANM